MAKKDILVIGSKGHKFADCVGWIDNMPYLGDYLHIILDMSSLTEQTLKILVTKKKDALVNLREAIREILWVKARIYCITQPDFYIEDDPFESYSNYDWCPIGLLFRKESGEKFNKKLEGYLSHVEKWSHFLNEEKLEQVVSGNHRYNLLKKKYGFFNVESILNNMADKKLAFKITIIEYDADYSKKPIEIIESNPMVFYPPTTKVAVKEGIDILIGEISGIQERTVILPSWVEDIRLKKEKDLRAAIEQNTKTILAVTAEIETQKKDLDNIIKFKGLLTEDGTTLEDLVEETLGLFGISVEKVEGNKEDRIFRFKDDIIPIEIKGKTASIPERDGLNQLIGRLKYDPPKNFKAHGILIGNHYKKVPLDAELKGRKKAFEPDVVKKAEEWNCCLISTLEIFQFLDRKFSGENIDGEFQDRLFNTIGYLVDF